MSKIFLRNPAGQPVIEIKSVDLLRKVPNETDTLMFDRVGYAYFGFKIKRTVYGFGVDLEDTIARFFPNSDVFKLNDNTFLVINLNLEQIEYFLANEYNWVV